MLQACSGLSPKQLQFCKEFLNDLNATAAYNRVYQVKNSATAAACAARLLTNAKVQEQIQVLMAERSRRTQISSDKVLHELALIAFSDMREFATWGTNGISLKSSEALEDDLSRAIAEINSQEMEHGGVHTRVKLYDKLSALKLLARHTGLLGDLNQAFNVFRRYGYVVKQEGTGYWLQDTYALEPDADLDDLEKDQ